MKRAVGVNSFRWPCKPDVLLCDFDDVIYTLNNQVVPCNRRGDYKVDDAEFDLINQKMEDWRIGN